MRPGICTSVAGYERNLLNRKAVIDRAIFFALCTWGAYHPPYQWARTTRARTDDEDALDETIWV